MRLKGFFKDSIEIYGYSESQDSLGQPVKTWTKISTILGFLNDSAGGKQFRNETIITTSTAAMFCENSVSLTTKNKIKCVETGKIYDVLYINPSIASVVGIKKFIRVDLEYNSEISL